MSESKAVLKNLRMSPYKVRLVADLVRGLKADKAIHILKLTDKAAAKPVRKVLESAVANAGQKGLGSASDLVVKSLQVGEATTLKRLWARGRGQADRIMKRASHVFVVLTKSSSNK